MMLRTTLMVGFPGETEEDFDELMNRNSIYKAREAELTETHICRMDKLANELIK
jgi:tRNA A37 methylthiotransferase MiaB